MSKPETTDNHEYAKEWIRLEAAMRECDCQSPQTTLVQWRETTPSVMPKSGNYVVISVGFINNTQV